MAKKKETEEMQNQETTPAVPSEGRETYKYMRLVPKLPIVLLDGTEEKRVAEYQKVVIVDPAATDTFGALQSLVGSLAEQCDAFAKYISSRNYSTAVKAIYSDPNVLSPELVNTVCDIMANMAQFAENTKVENKQRWLAGFREKKSGAISLLDRAKIIIAAQQNNEQEIDL